MNPIDNRRVGYAMAPLLVGIAFLLADILLSLAPHVAIYVFMAAILATARLAGRGPGLLASFLAVLAFGSFSFAAFGWQGWIQTTRPFAVPFFLCAAAATWMASIQNNARHDRSQMIQNQEKFRRILMNLPDIPWTLDQTGKIVYISPRVKDFVGYSSADIYAGRLAFLMEKVHSADRGRLEHAYEKLFSAMTPLDEEFRFQHADGSWLWIQNRATPYRVKNAVFADGVSSDISDRKQAELELQSKTAFLEAQANSTIDGVLVVDSNGRIILHNQRFNEIFRMPPELQTSVEDGPVLRHATELIRDPESFLTRVKHLYSEPEATSRDEIELKDGTILDRYSSPVKSHRGQYYGRIWTFRDITAQKRREDTLRQLSAAVEQSPVSVVITDPHGNISYVNRKFTQCTGYPIEEVQGRNSSILNSGYSPRETYKVLWSTILQGKEWRGEFRNRKKNGDLYWEEAVISPIMDESGAITHFLAVKEDTTERRALESELHQAQKLEAIGQLAAGIAHEINTPIQYVGDNTLFLKETWQQTARILDAAQRLRGEMGTSQDHSDVITDFDALVRSADLSYLSQEVPKAIEQTLDGIGRVTTIVRAMKEFSHPGSDEKRAIDLNKAIQATVTIGRNEYKYVADVELRLDPELPLVVCFAGEINQVLLNLLVNAAHAIGDAQKLFGAGRGEISISTLRDGPWAEVRVQDSGAGIPEAIRGKIFDPFFTTKEVGKGTGQGLTMAQTVVVKKHSGRIWFETEVGKGTTFFVRLPISGEAMN